MVGSAGSDDLVIPTAQIALGRQMDQASKAENRCCLVPTNVRGVAALLKALQRGEMTAILPDQQPPAAGGEFALLFGSQALTVTLPHNLLKKIIRANNFGLCFA